LPLGVIGVAAGTVLLPEMSRRLAAGDVEGAAGAQNRSIALTLALTAPFLVAFLILPDEVVRGAFLRDKFDADAALRSAAVLAAYGLGLIPMVLIRSAVAGFQSRGDTTTPMLCFFAGLAVNLALKIGLYRIHGAVGLAMATAAGAWINFVLLILMGLRRRWMRPDAKLIENVAITTFCSGAAAMAAPYLYSEVDGFVHRFHFMRNELDIALTGIAAIVVYAMIYMLASLVFGRSLRRQLL